ncbi:Mbeg1-like protein [Lacticaseibacillus brantae]|nr:Mbeg1-like protein [Lacticaseibacillus brantae]
MTNMIQYVTQTKQTFSDRPLTEVDAAIFAQAAYFDFLDLERRHLTQFSQLTDAGLQARLTKTNWFPAKGQALLLALSHSPRFSAVSWANYQQRTRQSTQEQFAALTFDLGGGDYVVSFRGTTSTLVGWAEDFNMSYLPTVPSQRSAVKYLTDQMQAHPGRYWLVGHSKGGNLAIFAFENLPVALQADIQAVYSFDGPGGLPHQPLLEQRITKLVPQTAIVGILMTADQHFSVVQSDATMIFQHDLFSWQVIGEQFVRLAQTDWFSQYTQRMLTTWLATLKPDVRKNILRNLYGVLDVGDAKTMAELGQSLPRDLPLYLSELRKTDPLTRQQIQSAGRAMFGAISSSWSRRKSTNKKSD